MHAPNFDRSIEEPIAGAVAVRPGNRLVIVEGNYLLLKQPPWDQIRAALSVCVYVELDDETRRRGLVERHMRYGKTRSEAQHFVVGSDDDNANLVAATRGRADFIVRVDTANTPWSLGPSPYLAGQVNNTGSAVDASL